MILASSCNWLLLALFLIAGHINYSLSKPTSRNAGKPTPSQNVTKVHYRLGDIIAHPAGGCCGDHQQLARDIQKAYPNSLVTKYLQYSNVPSNYTALEIALAEVCPKNLRETNILIHLRLGDVVCGQSWHEAMKRPFPVEVLAKALEPYGAGYKKIGLCYDITQSSISSNCDQESREYIAKIKRRFPQAFHYYPNAFADIHFCAMMNVPLFVAGRGFFSRSIIEARAQRGLPSLYLGTEYFQKLYGTY